MNRPFVIGLTGSIGTGKSTTATMFRRFQIPVHESDQEVHKLLKEDPDVFCKIKALFPHCIEKGCIDRKALGYHVFENVNALKHLEEILHPRVRDLHMAFLEWHEEKKTPLVVLDIPLLFEAGYERVCDIVIATTCSPELQQERVLKRPGMGLEKFRKILNNQLPGLEKQRRATYVLETSFGRADTFRRLRDILQDAVSKGNISQGLLLKMPCKSVLKKRVLLENA